MFETTQALCDLQDMVVDYFEFFFLNDTFLKKCNTSNKSTDAPLIDVQLLKIIKKEKKLQKLEQNHSRSKK